MNVLRTGILTALMTGLFLVAGFLIGGQAIENPEADMNPATAHMFIINPLHGGLTSLFSGHPSTREGIARLKAIATQMDQAPAPGPWA